MVGTHARGIIAAMAYGSPVRDRPMMQLPRCAMRKDVLARRAEEPPVRASFSDTGELPTAVGLRDLCPKALQKGSASAVSTLPEGIAVVTKTLVVGRAQTSSVSRLLAPTDAAYGHAGILLRPVACRVGDPMAMLRYHTPAVTLAEGVKRALS